MAINTDFDLRDRVHAGEQNLPGRVVGIHIDRLGRVRYDVEYRDHRGALRSDWYDAQQLTLSTPCTDCA